MTTATSKATLLVSLLVLVSSLGCGKGKGTGTTPNPPGSGTTIVLNGVTYALKDHPRVLFDGTLVSQVNWPNDHPALTMQLGAVDAADAPAAYWSRLLIADSRYDDDLKYDLFPSIGQGGYNSNSYVSGIVQATAGIPTIPMSRFVGGERPVPASEFN